MAADEEIQLSWLRAFLAVHQTGSFTAAAARVHRAQSRVSAQVAQLERQLGMQLFVRGRSPARLTEAGAEFLPYAQAILQEVEAGVAALGSREGTTRGRVTVASYPGASALVLPQFIKRFRDQHPRAQVELREGLGHAPEEFVAHGDVDLAIRATQPPPLTPLSLLSSQPLFREPIVCLVPGQHPAADMESVEPTVLDGHTVVMTGEFGASAGHYSDLLAKSGVEPAAETVVGQPTTVAAFVHAGLGVGVLPALSARLLDTGGHVRVLPVADRRWVRDVVILTNRSRRYPPVVEAFIHALLAEPLHPAVLLPHGSTPSRPK